MGSVKKMVLRKRANWLLEVGLPEDFVNRYPHELSGGQLQRVAIARAISIQPKLLICDEATGALDVSIQNQIAKLLVKLVEEKQISCLFIGHDLALVRSVSQRIAVMYLGRIVELWRVRRLLQKQYIHIRKCCLVLFLMYIAIRMRKLQLQRESHPSPLEVQKGCAFAGRCNWCREKCKEELPLLQEIEPGHKVACFQFMK